MKKLVYILILGIFPLAFSCCSSSKINSTKKFQNNPPFKVVETWYKTWVGGQPGVKGYSVKVEIDNSEIVLDSVYFRNMKAKFKKDKTAANNTYLATFILPNRMNYILHKDPKKEFGNKPPVITEKIPFDLNDNEAVITYKVNNKTEYYKVSNVVEISKIPK